MNVNVARVFFFGVVFHILFGMPRAPIITGTVAVLSPHIRSTSIFKSVFVKLFRDLTEVLVLRGILMSRRRQVLSFLFFSTMTRLLAVMVLSAWIGMSHRMVMLSFSVTVLVSCSYHCSSTLMPTSLQIFQCICAAALLWRWMYS